MNRELHPWNLGGGIVNTNTDCVDMNTEPFLKFMVDSPSWEQGSPYPFRVGEELRPTKKVKNNMMFQKSSPYVLSSW